MAYVIKPCRGCGGPKDRAGAGIAYCSTCRAAIDMRPTKAERTGGLRSPEDIARQVRMAAMYRSGETLEQIGQQFGLTRERVRQLIKQIGLTRKSGGSHEMGRRRKAIKTARHAIRRDERASRTYGCSHAEAVIANEGRPLRAGDGLAKRYVDQVNNARTRGIAWEFTFPAWVAFWRDSGRLSERGFGSGKYVMARFGDVGPYSATNVYIATHNDNSRDCRIHHGAAGVPSYAETP